MKLIKIGSAPGNNIVINSPYVSSFHAEITLHDNGEIFIEDKNSTNGTFVGDKRLTPNVETPIKKGDLVRFGNVQLQWHQVPTLENPSKYKTILNIGSSHQCDINVNSQFVSRYHATLFVDKKGKCFIQDNDTKNGTEINGHKIPKGKKMPVKRNDQIVVADVDVTDEIKPHIPNPYGWLKWVGIGLCVAAVACGIVFLVLGSSRCSRDHEVTKLCGDPEKIESASVLVHGVYSIYLELENNPIHESVWNAIATEYPDLLRSGSRIFITQKSYTGTAFFLDREGRLGTNRHVAVPWEYEDENEKKEWQSAGEQIFNNHLPREVTSATDLVLYNLEKSVFWQMIRLQAHVEGQDLSYINSLIRQLRNTKFKIVGERDYFGIAYPGRMYESMEELSRCNLLDYSETDEIDLALIQLNDPHTPETVGWVYNPETFDTDKLKPQKDKLTWIGYPSGYSWALDPKIQQLRPQIRETMCSSTPSKYYFDVQGEIIGGASGSPVFDTKTYRLVGVAYARLINGATFGRVVQAKYLKEMYDKETK